MENREKVPVRYRKNAQTAALLDTLGLPAQQMADLVEDVKKQFFIETATWSLPLWEYQVGITPPANATETSRRNAIKAHLLAGGNTNADTVRDMATAMTGYAARVIMNDDYSYAMAIYSMVILGQVYTLTELSEPALKALTVTLGGKVLSNIFEHNNNKFFGTSVGSTDTEGGI